jgi:alkylated DNA repair protein (DNA oxidative demethylase)
VVLRRFALAKTQALLAGIEAVTQVSPLRHMVTPGGYTMSVAMTNCGEVGWTTDARGYLYSGIDPQTGNPWPAIPDAFATLCHDAAVAADYADFRPDACLINRYVPGANSRCIRIKTNRIYVRLSSLSRLACRRCSSLAALNAMTPYNV